MKSLLFVSPRPIGKAGHFGFAGEIVEALRPYTEADPNAILIQTYVCMGNLFYRRAHYRVGVGTRHYTNEYVVVVGQSGKARKGTSLNDVRRVVKEVDPTWIMASGGQVLSSGEGFVGMVRDANSDDDSGVDDKRRLVEVNEFRSTFKVMSRPGNTLSQLVCLAWDGGDLRITTKKPMQATAPHISIIGHVTEAALIDALNTNRSCIYDGFANRFLWAYATRSQRKALISLVEGEALESALAKLAQRAAEVWAFVNTLSDQRIDFDPTARLMWIDWYENVPDRHGIVGAVTDRAEAHVCRLAMIAALMDQSTEIRTEHLAAALEIWRYCSDSASYLFSDSSTATPVEKTAMAIHRALGAAPGGLTRTDVNRLVFRGNRSADMIEQALALLEGSGRAWMDKNSGSRQAERWFSGEPPIAETEVAA
jgi:Protein of unknown function (DUF3987)